MRALTWQGKREVRGPGGAGSGHPGTDRRDRADHHDRHLWVGSAPVRGARRLPEPGRRPRPRGRWASSRRSAPRSPTSPRVTASSCRSTSPAVDAGCVGAASTPSARRPRCATRARVRPSSATPRSTGRFPAGRPQYLRVPAGPLRSDQGARRGTGHPVRLPLRHPAHRLAGRRLRRRPDRRNPGGHSGSAPSVSSRLGSRRQDGERVIGVDLVPSGSPRASSTESRSWTSGRSTTSPSTLLDMTSGRGPDATIDAVGMEAHGSPRAQAAQAAVGLLPDALASP